MFKKLIILCVALVVVGLSMPALASYIGFDAEGNPNGCANPWKVDIDGEAVTKKCALQPWQSWFFTRAWTNADAQATKTFVNPLAPPDAPWENPIAQLATYRKIQDEAGTGGGARNRGGGMAFVPGTGEFNPTTKGFGMNYMTLTLSQLKPNTNYRVYLWSYEGMGVWADPNNTTQPWGANGNPSHYGVWSTTNPKEWLDTHGYAGNGGLNGEPCLGGYGPIHQPDGYNKDNLLTDTNMPCGLKNLVYATGGRVYMEAPFGTADDHLGEPNYRATICCAMTNSRGVATIYGWIDPTTWNGSMHIPLNGFMVVPEPATVALLGLGGLALIRRKRA